MYSNDNLVLQYFSLTGDVMLHYTQTRKSVFKMKVYMIKSIFFINKIVCHIHYFSLEPVLLAVCDEVCDVDLKRSFCLGQG